MQQRVQPYLVGCAHRILVSQRLGAKANVVQNRSFADVRVLQDGAELTAQIGRVHLPYIDAADADGSTLRPIKPQQKIAYGCFARARVPNDRQHFTGANMEADIVQHPAVSFVSKPYILECDIEAAGLCLGTRLQVRWSFRVKKSEDLFGGDDAGLQDAVPLADLLDGTQEFGSILQEGNERSDGEAAGMEQMGADDEQSGLRDGAEQLDGRHEPCVGRDPLLGCLHVFAVDRVEGLQARLLAIEQMHHVDAVDMLGDECVDPGQENADPLLAAGDDAAEYRGQDYEDGNDGGQHQRHIPVDADHCGKKEEGHYRIGQQGYDSVGE